MDEKQWICIMECYDDDCVILKNLAIDLIIKYHYEKNLELERKNTNNGKFEVGYYKKIN